MPAGAEFAELTLDGRLVFGSGPESTVDALRRVQIYLIRAPQFQEKGRRVDHPNRFVPPEVEEVAIGTDQECRVGRVRRRQVLVVIGSPAYRRDHRKLDWFGAASRRRTSPTSRPAKRWNFMATLGRWRTSSTSSTIGSETTRR